MNSLILPKSEFFGYTLSPVRYNMQLSEKYGSGLGWSEILQICRDEPDLIEFSDKKLNESDSYYEKANCSLRSVGALFQKFDVFEKFLNIEIIMKHQKIELKTIITDALLEKSNFSLKNNILLHDDSKIVIPDTLYTLIILREHYLGLH